MAESRRPIDELLDTVAVIYGKKKSSEVPILSLGGGAAVPAENRSGASTDQQLVRLWLESKRSAHTRSSYARDILLFNDFLARLPRTSDFGPPGALRDVTVRHVEAFAQHLIGTGKLRTAARRLSAVKSFLTFAQQTGYLHYNVGTVVKLPTFASGIADKILSESEVEACIYAATSGRNRMLIRFVYFSGCRVSEVRRLRWEHLSLRDDRLIVQVFGKGGRSRYVSVPPRLMEPILELKKFNLSGFVFETRGGKQMSSKDIWRVIRLAARSAGIRRNVSPHWLRHSHASHAIRNGAQIQVVQGTLGHTSVRTTGEYLHVERGDSSSLHLPETSLKNE